MAEYKLDNTKTHFLWDVRHEPVLTIKSGDTVKIETKEVTNDYLNIDSTTEDLIAMDFDQLYPLTGPIYVEGAEPGDTLAVEILDIKPKDWGWMSTLAGMGLLPERFPDAYLKTFDLTNGEYVIFRDDIKVPFDPFLGTMGVCPAGAKGESVMPPGAFGGNMDLRHLRKGATVCLPIQVEGALFSCGDAHAVQGDGEVCVTALEAPCDVELKFTLIKGKVSETPSFFTPSPLLPKNDTCGWQGTTGVGPDLMQAAKDAVSQMVDFVVEKTGLEPIDAYLLCSVASDLKITEIVDSGVYIVTDMLPLSIFK